MDAVKAKYLGRLKKDGLKPEIFFHPDHLHGAIERQNNEAAFSIRCIAKVLVSGAERAEYDFNAAIGNHNHNHNYDVILTD